MDKKYEKFKFNEAISYSCLNEDLKILPFKENT